MLYNNITNVWVKINDIMQINNTKKLKLLFLLIKRDVGEK